MQCQRAISGLKLRDRVRNQAVRTVLHMNTTILYIIKMVWACGPKTCRQLHCRCVPPRIPKSKTTWPSAEEMVHSNPRGHRSTTGDSGTQSVRKARPAPRSHGGNENRKRITPVNQVGHKSIWPPPKMKIDKIVIVLISISFSD